MDWTAAFLVIALAMMIEASVGYPAALFAAIGHPVTWMGRLIAALDKRFNEPAQSFEARRRAGILALLILLTVTGFVGVLAEILLTSLPLGLVLVAAVASTLLAARSLDEHVRRVADGLDEGGTVGGRAAVAMVVGRDPDTLDRHGVARAAIESLAENFSDGVVAPAVWFVLLGLPGAVIYKAINTADSMIGHRTPRHEAYGYAAARLHDLANLPASRLSVLFLVAAATLLPGADAKNAWRTALRDARRHRSPNAGWPEAAMAGALGLRLNGPKIYATRSVEDAYMGEGRAEAEADDIRRALNLYRLACLMQLVTLMLLGALASVIARW